MTSTGPDFRLAADYEMTGDQPDATERLPPPHRGAYAQAPHTRHTSLAAVVPDSFSSPLLSHMYWNTTHLDLLAHQL